ncbi:MAG: hypothetical protein IJ906_09970 [Oscillospiraceae bacterium]|nr:hypothetical protein [Oscillospiraceae bacterium]
MKEKDYENIPEVNSIRKTEYYCKRLGIGLSRRQITRLAEDNKIVHFPLGNSIMVKWTSLMEYINKGEITNNNTPDDNDFLSRRRSIRK